MNATSVIVGIPKPLRQPSETAFEVDDSAEVQADAGYESASHLKSASQQLAGGSPQSPKATVDIIEEDGVDPVGYESNHSESTEVTPNQQQQQLAQNNGSVHSTKSDRWKHECVQSLQSSIKSKSLIRANSAATPPRAQRNKAWKSNKSSSQSSSTDGKNNHISKVSFPQKLDTYEDDDDAHSEYDLKSKPGYVGFVKEDEVEEFQLLGDNDDNDSPSADTSSRKACSTSSSTSSTPTLLTKDRVRAFMTDYYEDFDSIFRHGKSSRAIWGEFFKQYYTDEIIWVRSSSNTLRGPELLEHFVEDIIGIRMQMVSIDSIQILVGGLVAVVLFTAEQEFLFRGQPVTDRAVMSLVMHVVNGGEILIGHEHRCAGKPIPQNTRWK